ncbi:ABC-type transport system ATP-binding protein (probable substrate dipeptide/oligopeptide) [Natronomonas pharaonis DSM 2160]|uniref:ABC-type transport system ATP-binding protein (Probable substrate dipeptide/oligopeptide) n=1 Tax=Natronomonas pharaonis (strain ATCC 35678 / DSM 2160 / CIP 103997 / JCM 8858 / NBRC 14720 / NCIMB 2260 / Gabara) TaxID=348780 RepID=A0A1U7EXI3_NATPD|nr:ABC transporter ATP-binding protein [Natronomonas pharaonis]CAI49883.1 ABC-type transport system ATP-binding protein (probable substrate dipeptide/oligopeptide) [Natronomonas pharaonis DSM 2160]
MMLLNVTDLRITYESATKRAASDPDDDRTPAVDGASLTVDRGEVVALVGESGSGKSTLARSIVGLHRPGEITDGEIRLDGTELAAAGEATLRTIRGRQVGVAFQDPTAAFDPVYPVGEQITEAIAAAEGHQGLFESLGVPPFADRDVRKQRREQAAALLDDVGVDDPSARLDAYPGELSGGQCQRAMLATALAGNPDLLIADEPTAGLDATTRACILELLESLAEERDLGVLVITHDLAVVAQHCDRVAVLSDGRVVETGATTAVVADPEHPETRSLVDAGDAIALGKETRQQRTAVDGGGMHANSDRPLKRPTNNTSDDDSSDSTAVVELAEVTKTYAADTSLFDRLRPGSPPDSRTALDAVSLSIQRGETLGLVGESGGGKSTVVELIAGLTAPTEGTVRIDGRRAGTVDERGRELRSDVGVVFQHPEASFDPRWPVGRSIAEPLRRLGWPKRRRTERVEELLTLVGLPSSVVDARPQQLSGGQIQRAAIARATATDPRVLLLDEPVSALDATTRAHVLDLFVEMQRQRSGTAVFVSHDLGAVGRVADRIGVLERGRLVEIGDAGRILSNPSHPHTQTLLESVPERPTEIDVAATDRSRRAVTDHDDTQATETD